MNKILILYPSNFLCRTKFDRKVGNIVSGLNEFEIVFPWDGNKFIERYFGTVDKTVLLNNCSQWMVENITHAIVFDDGEEFVNELKFIEELKIPTRLVRIKITRVVNIKKEQQYAKLKKTEDYEYIGRGSYWGNPYSMYGTGDGRDDVIRKFKYDFDFEKFPNKNKAEVFKLAGKRLGCFCKPEKCHGDILADFLNSWDDGL